MKKFLAVWEITDLPEGGVNKVETCVYLHFWQTVQDISKGTQILCKVISLLWRNLEGIMFSWSNINKNKFKKPFFSLGAHAGRIFWEASDVPKAPTSTWQHKGGFHCGGAHTQLGLLGVWPWHHRVSLMERWESEAETCWHLPAKSH